MAPSGNLDPICAPPPNFFLLNFTRIKWFFRDLGFALFDIPKDAVLAEILILSKFFGFPAVNWALKWTKTVNFGCVPFRPKFEILKDFLNTMLVLLEDYLCLKFQEDRTIFGGVSPTPQHPPLPPKKRGPFHRCWIKTENLENV